MAIAVVDVFCFVCKVIANMYTTSVNKLPAGKFGRENVWRIHCFQAFGGKKFG